VISLLSGNFEKRDVFLILCSIGFFGLVVYTFRNQTKNYEIAQDGISILQRKGSYVINKEDILEIKSIDYKSIKGSARNFGIGGIFGFSGTFSNKKFGEMIWFLTRTDTLLMINTDKQKIVISPDDPQLFLIKSKEIFK
jgi:uncharacterized membrane protein (Fun14 family)